MKESPKPPIIPKARRRYLAYLHSETGESFIEWLRNPDWDAYRKEFTPMIPHFGSNNEFDAQPIVNRFVRRLVTLGVIFLIGCAIYILTPAVWALLSPFHRGLAVGVMIGAPVGIFIVGLCQAAREGSNHGQRMD